MNNTDQTKTVLITGASRGIGKGIAMVMAAKGYDVCITYATKKDDADSVAHTIENEYRRRCIVYQADFGDVDTPARLADSVISYFGRLDVLVNNAGFFKRSDILEIDQGSINSLINVDFISPLLLTKAVARHMVSCGIEGSIVNITSTRAERAYPNDFLYGGAKAGLTRATQSIALELAPHKIRVNCVAPGATKVRTRSDDYYEKLGNKIPLGRMGVPLDVAEAVAWLVSNEASYITGITLKVDGGLILPGMPEDVRPEAGYGWGLPVNLKKQS